MEICKVCKEKEKKRNDFVCFFYLEQNFGQVILKMVEHYHHHLILFQVRNQFVMFVDIYIDEYLVVQKHI
jgi:hypothetical protein